LIKSKTTIVISGSPTAISTGDIDDDGDIDIIIGHNNSATSWVGISNLVNNGGGNFQLQDSVLLENIPGMLNIAQLNDNSLSEFVGREFLVDSEHLIIVWNNDFTDIQKIDLEIDEICNYISTGDIDGNGLVDIAFASNHGYFWGAIYNYGNRQFSIPEFHFSSSPAIGIDCGNLNGDNRDDIVVSYADASTDIHYSFNGYYDSLTFESISGQDIGIKDFDNDGDNDIVLSIALMAIAGKISWIENISNDTLIHIKDTVISDWYPSDMQVTNINDDNLPDIAFVNGFPIPEPPDTTVVDTIGGVYIMYNEGDFQFSDPKFIPLNFSGDSRRIFSCNDMDNNGFNDLVIARIPLFPLIIHGKISILYNDGHGNFLEEPQHINKHKKEESCGSIRCFPNPFTEETNIEYNIKNSTLVTLDIYDFNGNHIEGLTKNHKIQSGLNSIKWNGISKREIICQPGIYIVVLKAGNQAIQSIKLIKY
jgi:hypothetical protein